MDPKKNIGMKDVPIKKNQIDRDNSEKLQQVFTKVRQSIKTW